MTPTTSHPITVPIFGEPRATIIAADVIADSPFRIIESGETRDTEAGDVVELD